MKKKLLSLTTLKYFFLLLLFVPVFADEDFERIIAEAKGQTVYFNAWGGDESINQYITWAANEVQNRYQVKVKQVKVGDISVVVGRILAEKKTDQQGSVDLMWLNGENFKTMKQNGLLYGPFTPKLPNIKWLDFENNQNFLIDFSEPVNGMEAPWGTARLVFIYDQNRTRNFPQDIQELMLFAKKSPGRVTYPRPPDFHGTSFVKQILLELTDDHSVFENPVTDVNFEVATKPLWQYLDTLHPYLWRSGKNFPSSLAQVHQLFQDGELLLSFTFNPNEASHLINKGEFPRSVRTYVHRKGMLGNTHFLAIPYNASAKEGALVLINFLLSPEAQARKADLRFWGDPTVLSLQRLNNQDRSFFKNIPQGIASLSEKQLGKVLLEPHSSWVSALEREWLRRYGR